MTVNESDLVKPEDVPRDCYLCANAPKINIGKPYCIIHAEQIEPMFTGKGPAGGWTCEDVAKDCSRFKPKKIYFDKERKLYYEKR